MRRNVSEVFDQSRTYAMVMVSLMTAVAALLGFAAFVLTTPPTIPR